ncbi:Neuroligin-2 [Portunus trituberculatus]|uniref:Neuroligin-2 n=1 Tax=Portunus trituberculatus TaxID=210409 RepID=A0A5B7F0I1_PORTR|nr:Neuroligin-2 [Portunus trituberculatus]
MIHQHSTHLTIASPSTQVSINVNNMYPVLFYIHGGDLDHGASNLFPGHMLAAYGEVVVVTFNYRLGALGFLSTGDANSPGNYGLMDMAMALEWVYTNIRFFNGDRNKITVFGPGAGGAMAGVLAVLPRTKDYVSQVIAQVSISSTVITNTILKPSIYACMLQPCLLNIGSPNYKVSGSLPPPAQIS